eukprot:CAMPEP_0184482198 /NCGR_PEP_ID=MMETSP0113_2-20130426/3764_1 /TAXON_ID=91329 /ORGANISM="Norrisiella sphaerica, Strain BC52" /LENGTH=1135 /DNA_ID=CAMNT_0026861799 /DNA_START=430 /DNA_END=3837 /DNA_ORIENTATION=-
MRASKDMLSRDHVWFSPLRQSRLLFGARSREESHSRHVPGVSGGGLSAFGRLESQHHFPGHPPKPVNSDSGRGGYKSGNVDTHAHQGQPQLMEKKRAISNIEDGSDSAGRSDDGEAHQQQPHPFRHLKTSHPHHPVFRTASGGNGISTLKPRSSVPPPSSLPPRRIRRNFNGAPRGANHIANHHGSVNGNTNSNGNAETGRSAGLNGHRNTNAKKSKMRQSSRAKNAENAKIVDPVEEVRRRTREITSYGKSRRWEDALKALSGMEREGLPVDRFVYNAVLACLAKAGIWSEALKIIRRMQRRKEASLHPDDYSHSSVLTAFAKAREWEKAEGYFETHCDGISSSIYVYNALAHAMARGGQWRRAMGLVGRMREAGVHPDIYTFSTIITACVQAKQYDAAKKMFARMRIEKVVPNAVTLTAMVPIYAETGDWMTALQTYEALSCLEKKTPRRKFALPSSSSSSSSSSSPAASGTTDSATSHAIGRKHGVDVTVLGAVVSALATNGQIERAEDLIYRAHESKESFANTAVYNALLRGYAKEGLWEQALSVLKEMSQRKLKADTTTYLEMINSCGPNQLSLAAQALSRLQPAASRSVSLLPSSFSNLTAPEVSMLPELEDDQLEFKVEAANALMCVLAKAGSGSLALELLNHLRDLSNLYTQSNTGDQQERQKHPAAAPVNGKTSVQQGFSRRRGLGRGATHRLHNVQTRRKIFPVPDEYTYSLAMKALSNEGRYEDALSVFDLMQKSPPGHTRSTLNAGNGNTSGDYTSGNTKENLPNEAVVRTAAVQLAGRLGHWERSIDIFRGIKNPDPTAICNVMQAIEKQNKWEQGLSLLEELIDANTNLNSGAERDGLTARQTGVPLKAFQSVLRSMSSSGAWRPARHVVLDLMPRASVPPTALSFELLANACINRYNELQHPSLLHEKDTKGEEEEHGESRISQEDQELIRFIGTALNLVERRAETPAQNLAKQLAQHSTSSRADPSSHNTEPESINRPQYHPSPPNSPSNVLNSTTVMMPSSSSPTSLPAPEITRNSHHDSTSPHQASPSHASAQIHASDSEPDNLEQTGQPRSHQDSSSDLVSDPNPHENAYLNSLSQREGKEGTEIQRLGSHKVELPRPHLLAKAFARVLAIDRAPN